MSAGITRMEGSDPARDVARGHVALFAAQFFFAMFPVIGVLAMDQERGFDPWVLAAWRLVFGALAMAGLALALNRASFRPAREDLPRFAWCAVMGIVANQGLFLYGLQMSQATDAGLVMCMIPVWTWLIAVSVRQERFAWKRALGVALAFAGTIPLAQTRGMGNGLMIANTFCYAVYLVIAKPLTAKYPPFVVLAWVYLISLPAVPFLLWGRSPLPQASGDSEIWLSLTYVLVGATVLSYVLNLFGLQRVRSSTTAFYIYLQPIITAIAAALMLGEEVPADYAWAAVGLVLGGVLVLERTRK